MKKSIIACLDNYVGWELLKFLLADDQIEVIYVITHPEKNALYYEQIKSLCAENTVPCTDITDARENFEKLFLSMHIDYLLSLYFDYILDERFINLPICDAINLHPGYLPYNKGFFYYVWALLDGTPAGVSIHKMIIDVDGGSIISQKRVVIETTDTGETIYKKHEEASITLFKYTWPNLLKNTYQTYPHLHEGTRKSLKATRNLLDIDPYQHYKAIDLINRIRVLSFKNCNGCRIEIGGEQYSIKMELNKITEQHSHTEDSIIPDSRYIPGGNKTVLD